MPVKVRCSECERVVNAPDRARGKAVKCPQCGKPIRVPVGTAAAAGKKAAAPPPSSSAMIANLDLDRLEDAQTRICPKCSAEVGAEDIECPECGITLATGLLSAKQQADRNRKGPDPRKYYGEFFSDSFEFWKKNKKLSIGLCVNCLMFTTLAMFCLFMSLWSAKPLVRVFWWFIMTITILMPPGLAWNLHTKIIDATLRKKKKLPKYHFDKLLGTALGFKFILWFLDVAAPLHILALVFLFLHFPIVVICLEGAAVVFASLLFPLAMSHMSMPITTRGWLLHKMSGPFFRTLPALAYWDLFLLLMMIVPIGCIAGGAFLSGTGLLDIAEASNFNSTLHSKLAEIEDLPKNSNVPKELHEWQGKKPVEPNWNPFLIPAVLMVGAAGFFGATAVFMMRANGSYTRYFLDYLDLQTAEEEVKYVPKVARLEDLEDAKAGLTWQKVLVGVGVTGVLGFAFGSAGAALMEKPFLTGMGAGLMFAGILCALVGAIWRLAVIFKHSIGWFLASLFVPFANLIYSMLHWEKVKFPLVVSLVGGLGFYPLGMAIVLFTAGPEVFGFGGPADDPRAAAAEQVPAPKVGAGKAAPAVPAN
ncbi:MAG TPA: hypothetical protein VGP63_28780 [Planctomycetaceae bacterium]|nr:hypothetical protein [Planctomycetaceae bacterium]